MPILPPDANPTPAPAAWYAARAAKATADAAQARARKEPHADTLGRHAVTLQSLAEDETRARYTHER